jgi:hypothetical protein
MRIVFDCLFNTKIFKCMTAEEIEIHKLSNDRNFILAIIQAEDEIINRNMHLPSIGLNFASPKACAILVEKLYDAGFKIVKK